MRFPIAAFADARLVGASLSHTADIDPQSRRLRADLEFLTSDLLAGRVSLSREAAIAALHRCRFRENRTFARCRRFVSAGISVDRTPRRSTGARADAYPQPSTLGVPGQVVRSVHTDQTGMPVFHAGTFVTDRRSPLSERWRGWYVTGTHGTATHMGNVTAENKETGELDVSKGANLTDPKWKIDTGAYLSPTSDIVLSWFWSINPA